MTHVDGISIREVAERAGVDLDFVTRLVDVGVLAPGDDGTFTEGDVRRSRLYQGLERTGLPLDAIREALDAGELSFGWLDAPLYDLIAPLSPRSFQDVATETGSPWSSSGCSAKRSASPCPSRTIGCARTSSVSLR